MPSGIKLNKIEDLKRSMLNCNVFSVYDYDCLSMQELLCKFFEKINQCVDVTNKTVVLVEWLVSQGLKEEVAKKLESWLLDGTLSNIINETIFKDLNNKITVNTNNIVSLNDKHTKLENKLNKKMFKINICENDIANCVMDVSEDQSSKFQQILDVLNVKDKPSTIIIPEGVLSIKNTLRINFTKVNIECYGEINFTGDASVLLDDISFDEKSPDEVYLNGGQTVKGLHAYGDGREGRKTCIRLNAKNNNHVGSSRVKFIDCKIHHFNKGFEFGTRSYANIIDNCSIYQTAIAIDILKGHDCGEKYTVTNSMIFNSNVGIQIDNELSDIFVTNSSIDYTDNSFVVIKRGRVIIDNCHLESFASFHDTDNKIPFRVLQGDGNCLTITNSYILFNTPQGVTNPKYIFECLNTPYSPLVVQNCTLQGFKTTSGVWVKGEGLVKFINNNSFEWDTFTTKISPKYNHIDDGEFFDMSTDRHANIIATPGNVTVSEAYGQWDGGNCYKATKNADAQSHGEVIIYAPYNHMNTNAICQFDIESNVECTIDIALKSVFKGADGQLHYSRDIKRQGGIVLKANEKKTVILDNRQVYIDGSCEYLGLTIGLFNAPRGEYKFKNLYLATY